MDSGNTILVVEDEESLLKVLTDSLTLAGFKVLGAKDGKQGLESALKNIPKLILLDIVMPNMDGIEMLRRLKLEPSVKNIPVILLTNLGETSKMLQAKELGAEDYLIKSHFKIEDIVKMVKEKLSL